MRTRALNGLNTLTLAWIGMLLGAIAWRCQVAPVGAEIGSAANVD